MKRTQIIGLVILVVLVIAIFFLGKGKWWMKNGTTTGTGSDTGTGTADTGTGILPDTGTSTIVDADTQRVSSESIEEEKKIKCAALLKEILDASTKMNKSQITAQQFFGQLTQWQKNLQVKFGNYADSTKCPKFAPACKIKVNQYNTALNAFLTDQKQRTSLIQKCNDLGCPTCK